MREQGPTVRTRAGGIAGELRLTGSERNAGARSAGTDGASGEPRSERSRRASRAERAPARRTVGRAAEHPERTSALASAALACALQSDDARSRTVVTISWR